MPHARLDNVNITSKTVLPTPTELKQQHPISEELASRIESYRQNVRQILNRQDPRLLAIVGPCSIHDIEGALTYAHKLKNLADSVNETMMIIMRVYFEKPRTSVGWKGIINDPHLDNSFSIWEGLHHARDLLLELARIGLPCATEALDPFIPQYIGDLITWTAIGARTTESQTHREMASGLSTPVGFKNATSGDFTAAINALTAISHPHHFLGITQEGQCAIFHTSGNMDGHLILRGGHNASNYDLSSINQCKALLTKADLPRNLIIDCSHGNSGKDHTRQPAVLRESIKQVSDGTTDAIRGFMLESYLKAGNQKLTQPPTDLAPGVSITDACIDWDTTEALLRETDQTLKK